MTFQVQKTENTGIVYADPSDPGLTVRVKHSTVSKTLSGVPMLNQVTEIIVNDDVPITVGSVNTVDALSIRLRVSGTHAAHGRKVAVLAALRATLAAWENENVFKGFNPLTVPSSPAA